MKIRTRSATALAAAAGLAAGIAQAQPTITPVVMEGDAVGSVGLVTRIDNLAVNNAGEWIVEADTDNADTDVDVVVIKNGSLYLQESQPLSAPSGTLLDSFDAFTLNNNGDSAWNFFLAGNVTSNSDSGIFFNDTLVFQEGALYAGDGLSTGTPYIGFFETKFNDNNQILVMASVDDPEIASTVDRALVIVGYDPAAGTYTETLVAAESSEFPDAPGEPVLDFGTSPEEFAFNNAGAVLFVADLDSGSSATDLALYRWQNGEFTQLAREGSPSPVAGRNWSSLGSVSVDLNNAGDYVFVGSLDGDSASNVVMIKNGQVFKQKGDPAPGIEDYSLTSFGTSSIVQISDAGDVLWYGDWNDPNTSVDTGLFLNDTLLIQKGVTVVDGSVVTTIASGADAYMLSDNGRYAIVELTLQDGRNIAAMIELDGADPCPADFNNDGTLTLSDFVAFRNAYTAGDLSADFNGDGTLALNDFVAFRNAYTAGCP